MTWLRLALGEWQRRPLRMGLTMAGVAIATAAMFSLLAFEQAYREGVQRELDRLGAQVLVVPKGCPYDAASIALHGANWPCYLKEKYLDEVRATPGISAAAPALMSASYGPDGRQTVYVGVETNMLALKTAWQMRGSFPQAGELLAGSEVAHRLGWQLGQTVTLPALPARQAVVRAVLAPTQSADDGFIFLPLADAQQFLRRPGELTHILVRLADPNALDEVVGRLRGCDAGLYMNVVPLAHLFRTIQGVVSSTRLLLVCLALVAWLAAAAGVSNALLMAVAERTREIGVLRALGASRGQIFGLFWVQTLQICAVGAVCGIAIAYGSSREVEGWVRSQLPFTPREPLIHWQTAIAAGCLLGSLLLGSLAGFIPAARAALLLPVEAMRQGDRA